MRLTNQDQDQAAVDLTPALLDTYRAAEAIAAAGLAVTDEHLAEVLEIPVMRAMDRRVVLWHKCYWRWPWPNNKTPSRRPAPDPELARRFQAHPRGRETWRSAPRPPKPAGRKPLDPEVIQRRVDRLARSEKPPGKTTTTTTKTFSGKTGQLGFGFKTGPTGVGPYRGGS